ncbi:MAG: peptidoglycan-binding protein [Anaerolineales bacterium]|nr:MAG: peptidoglycan-binding protein [Anaerolineales bacterium]
MNRKLILVPLVLILLLSACNLPTGTQEAGEGLIFTLAAQTITAAAQETQPPTEINTSTPIPSEGTATSTPTPAQTNATNTSIPCNVASFVADVTIPDNTNIAASKAFTKTWRLRNSGSCTWTSGYQLVFDSGDAMSGPASQQLTNGSVAPGQTVDVTVNLTAPAAPGTYKGNWKLKEPGGVIFALASGPFWVQIQAVAESEAQWKTFRSSDSGVEVYAIQHLLRAHGHDLDVDGKFGPITLSKVKDFQSAKGLTADGIVGPQTWQALIIQAAQGKTGQEVRAIQRLLRDKFNYSIQVDGIFGPDTADAVKDFQTANGLTVDGIVGPLTWRYLIGK